MLLAAWPQVAYRNPSSHLVIAGKGEDGPAIQLFQSALSQGNVGLLQLLIAHVADNGDEPTRQACAILRTHFSQDTPQVCTDSATRVHFMGYLREQVLADMVAASRVPVVPSVVAEAFPLSYVQALACGLVPVTTNAGGLSHLGSQLGQKLPYVGDHVMVGLDGPGVVGRLASRISEVLDILEDPGRRLEVALAARELVMGKYTWPAVALRIQDIYHEAVSSW